VLNAVLAAVAVSVAIRSPGSPLDAMSDHPGSAAAVGALAVVTLYALRAAYVDLPRALVAARSVAHPR
jgi:hypothetical protein